jgi:hypothetical protein
VLTGCCRSQEDERLAQLVTIHGPKKWSQIAYDLGSKGSKQVSCLSFSIHPWTSPPTSKVHISTCLLSPCSVDDDGRTLSAWRSASRAHGHQR